MLKLPEKYRKKFREYENMSLEEKQKYEDEVIKSFKETNSLARNMDDEQLKYIFRHIISSIDTSQEGK